MKVLLKCFYGDDAPGAVVEVDDAQASAMLENGSAEAAPADDAPAPAPKSAKSK